MFDKLITKLYCLKEFVSCWIYGKGSKLLGKLYRHWLELYDESDYWCYCFNRAGLDRKYFSDAVKDLEECEEFFVTVTECIFE